MASVQSLAYMAQFRLMRRKQIWTDPIKLDRSIRRTQQPGRGYPPKWLHERHDVRSYEVRGSPCFTVRPKSAQARRHVLYLHGGAYVHPPEPEHWGFVSRLVTGLGCAVTLPLYPLAPDHQYAETIGVVREIYEGSAGSGDPAEAVVMGDSAGGGLTLVLAQQLKADGAPQPRNLVLLSPWLDITMTDPAQASIDRRDPFLSIPGLVEAGRLYAGTLDRSDPLVSPLGGDLEGLGRLSVFTGTADVLFSDARRLWFRLSRRGIDLDYFEYEDMFHGWMLQRPIPEAQRATRQIIDILRR